MEPTKVKKPRKQPAPIIMPKIDPDKFIRTFGLALNWYNNHWAEADYRKSALAYLKHAKLTSYVPAVNACDAIEVRTIGAIGNLIIRNEYVELEYVERLLFKLEALKEKYTKVEKPARKEVVTSVVKTNIQDRILDLARNIGADLDEEIENFVRNGYKSEFSVKDFLQTRQVTGPVSKKIAEFYKAEIDEVTVALSRTDEELTEAYSHIPKRNLKKYLDFLKNIVTECGVQVVAVKALRKPRAKKVKSPLKLTEMVKYKATDAELNLTSIVASKIIGAAELWIYNSAYRKLAVYYAADAAGLSVNRQSLINFDATKSEMKTLRDPKKFFADLKNMGKRAMQNAFKAIKTKSSTPKAHINEDMILLTVN